MKINNIKLKNIHSLKGLHEVDFANGPLAQTGLFAIIGPTGSGKSTLLDAITLALFNSTPRSGSLSRAAIEKTGAIITRNTNDAFCEAEYESFGKTLRSRWEISRARTGKLGDILPVLKKAIVSEPEFAYEYAKGYKLKNIDVLFSPLNDSIGINKIFVNKGLFSNIFENLKNIYDLIFIDTSNESMLPANNYLFNNADYINFIINSDVYSVRQIIKFLKRAEDTISLEKCNIFANNFNEDYFGMSIEEVVSKIFGIFSKVENLKEIMENRVFYIPYIENMVQVNNRQDGLFNPKNNYIKKNEQIKLIEAVIKLLRIVSNEYLKEDYSKKYNNHLGGWIKNIFKK